MTLRFPTTLNSLQNLKSAYCVSGCALDPINVSLVHGHLSELVHTRAVTIRHRTNANVAQRITARSISGIKSTTSWDCRLQSRVDLNLHRLAQSSIYETPLPAIALAYCMLMGKEESFLPRKHPQVLSGTNKAPPAPCSE